MTDKWLVVRQHYSQDRHEVGRNNSNGNPVDYHYPHIGSSSDYNVNSPNYLMAIKDGLVDPNWNVKVRKRQDATLPYKRSESSYQTAYGSQSTVIRKNFGAWTGTSTERSWYSGIPGSPLITPGVVDPQLADQALVKVKRQISRRTQNFQAMIPLIELRDLRGLVRSMSVLSLKTVKALKSLRKPRVQRRNSRRHELSLLEEWKRASDMWLTYSFGMAPMMSDAASLAKSIAAYIARYDSIDRLSGRSEKIWTTSSTPSNVGGSFAQLRFKVQTVHKLSYRYRVGHHFNMMSDTDYNAVAHFGLELPNLPSVAWEVTAFSWVFDYFTTIGDVLEDTFTGSPGSCIFVVRNRRYEAEATFPMWAHNIIGEGVTTSHCKPGVVRYWEFQREKLASLPSRILRFKTLDEMGLNGVNKLLNLVAVYSKIR